MTIQKRIFAGHVAVAFFLLVPAIYAVGRLGVVAKRTHRSLQTGLDRLYVLDQFRSAFENVVLLKGGLHALEDPVVPQEGGDIRQKTEASLQMLRRIYARARPHFLVRREEDATHLDALLGYNPEEAQAGERGAGAGVEAPRAAPGALEPPSAPGEGRGMAAGRAGDLWSEEDIDRARQEIDSTYDDARRRMLDETAATDREADGAVNFSLLGLSVAIPLAVASTFLAVHGMRKTLRLLMSATSAVSAGKFGVSVPVTGDDEMSRLTDAFNKMSESLAQLEKMKAGFLSVASHELKTSLTCIKGFAGALRASLPSEAEGNPDVVRYLVRIDQEADLLARKVSELLTFGMIEAGQLKLEPREIMTEGFLLMLGEAFRPIAAERHIDFDVDVSEVPSRFTADPDRLNQVLLNLLDNAFKYTPSGGRVALKGLGREGVLEIEVADSGPGIPPSEIKTIFEMYARVRSSSDGGRGGAGLGLAVARGIVLAHGGTIGVSSEPGKGSRFMVRLPARPQPEMRAREVA